jgi:hypothetical protein
LQPMLAGCIRLKALGKRMAFPEISGNKNGTRFYWMAGFFAFARRALTADSFST